MVVRYVENATAAQYDKEATELMRQVANWEKQAESARSPENRRKYRAKAQESREKAITALQNANLAAARTARQ